jgi:hypothetical protein
VRSKYLAFRLWSAVAIAPAAILISAPAYAQGTAVLTGTVRDAVTKQPIADVVVTVTSPALQGEQIVITDARGAYRVPNLPPGSYAIRLDREAYKPGFRGDVALRVGSTIRLNLDLAPEAIKEEIVVTAAAPVVDVGSSSTGVNVNSDFVSRIPVSSPSGKGGATRSFESLAEVAPGANPDRYGVSISGTTSPENQYVVDGLSVNNPAFGILGTQLPVEFVKDVNIISGGYMPEYGRATGGYLDVVTKTGGNEFHGSVFATITPGFLEGAREPVRREGSTISTTTNLSSQRSFGFEIGGPILKDRLWFYAGLVPSLASYRLDRALNVIRTENGMPVVDASGFTQTDRLAGTETTYNATQRSLLYIGKLTVLVDPNNTVTLSVFGSPTSSGGNGDFGINPRDGSVEIENANSGGLINGTYGALAHNYVSNAHDVSAKWSSAFRDKTLLLDVIAGLHHEDNAVRAADGTKVASGQGLADRGQVLWQRTDPAPHSINDFEAKASTARCNEGGGSLCPVTTYYSGGPGALNESALDRLQFKVVGTSIFSALGQHVAKAGVDVELMRYESQRGYSGSNIFFEGEDGTTFDDFRRFGFLGDADKPQILDKFEAVSTSMTIGGFVQDSFSILDRVTLNAGVRYDAQFLYGYDERLALALPNQISPRVGVIYDFTREGRSKIFASFARFYENVPLDMVDRSIPGERQITSTHDASICNPRYVEQQKTSCESDESRVVTGDLYSPNQRWGVVGSDKAPVDPDIEPQSSDEIAIGGEYEVFPHARVGLQYTKRWQNRVIEDMSRDEAQTYFIGNPGYGIATDFPKPTRDYDALTVFFQRAFKDLWLAQASYTLSYLRGNWAGLFKPESGQLDPNINSDFDLTSLLDNREGPLPGDRRHSLRVLGAKDFVLPGSVLVNAGLSYSGRSGDPTNYLGSHPIYGTDQVFILPRGSGERMPWTHSVDAHVGVGFKLAKDSDALVYADIFNLFNFQSVVTRDQRYTQDSVLPIANGTPADLDTPALKYESGETFDPAVSKNPNFGNPTAYQAPRQFRIGARVTF